MKVVLESTEGTDTRVCVDPQGLLRIVEEAQEMAEALDEIKLHVFVYEPTKE